ncbi:MAG: sugar ABC transporter substrate-binding protein [Planctomycetota bacterium]|jgi:ribose transport system substrate-binding protein/inositol transport system substrate-binding protein|nr:sugar ABC transporter substrate-binding protein [Planctomycetota bacterium]
MKSILAKIVVVALFFPFFVPAASGAAERSVALCMSHMSNAFTIEMSDAVRKRAAELGVTLIVNDGNKDAARQVGQIESLIAQGIDGIIVEAVSVDGIQPAVNLAKETGVPLVTVNQKATNQENAVSFVGVSHEDGGELEMAEAAKAIGGKGNVALLLGPMGSDAQIGRSAGYKKVLDRNPGMQVVFEQTANWDTEAALRLMENWLQAGTKIDVVVAQNDGMALGALKAVEDAQLQKEIKVYGLDAVPDALAAVKDGRLTGTVSQNTSAQGAKSVDVMVDALNGKQVPKEVIVEQMFIDKANVAKYLK